MVEFRPYEAALLFVAVWTMAGMCRKPVWDGKNLQLNELTRLSKHNNLVFTEVKPSHKTRLWCCRGQNPFIFKDFHLKLLRSYERLRANTFHHNVICDPLICYFRWHEKIVNGAFRCIRLTEYIRPLLVEFDSLCPTYADRHLWCHVIVMPMYTHYLTNARFLVLMWHRFPVGK